MSGAVDARGLVREARAWSRWWVALWAVDFVGLLALVPVLPFWHWWTAVAVAFGIPEFIGARIQDDAYPPLTHVLVRFLHPEIGFPMLLALAGAVGAYWLGLARPGWLGLWVGFIGWLIVHFLPRWMGRG